SKARRDWNVRPAAGGPSRTRRNEMERILLSSPSEGDRWDQSTSDKLRSEASSWAAPGLLRRWSLHASSTTLASAPYPSPGACGRAGLALWVRRGSPLWLPFVPCVGQLFWFFSVFAGVGVERLRGEGGGRRALRAKRGGLAITSPLTGLSTRRNFGETRRPEV